MFIISKNQQAQIDTLETGNRTPRWPKQQEGNDVAGVGGP